MQVMFRYKSAIVGLVIATLLLLSLTWNDIQDVELEPDVFQLGDQLQFSPNAVLSLAKLAMVPPPAPVSSSCSPPPSPPSPPSCEGQSALTGQLLPRPRRLVLLMMFSFEVDTLEINLREQLDWVDMIFIVEATTTTKGVSRSQLTSDPIREQILKHFIG